MFFHTEKQEFSRAILNEYITGFALNLTQEEINI